QWSPGVTPADAVVFRLANNALNLTHRRDINDWTGEWAFAQRRKNVGASGQNLAAGTRQHIHRFSERLGPEIQRMSSRRRSRSCTPFYTTRRLCTGRLGLVLDGICMLPWALFLNDAKVVNPQETWEVRSFDRAPYLEATSVFARFNSGRSEFTPSQFFRSCA